MANGFGYKHVLKKKYGLDLTDQIINKERPWELGERKTIQCKETVPHEEHLWRPPHEYEQAICEGTPPAQDVIDEATDELRKLL